MNRGMHDITSNVAVASVAGKAAVLHSTKALLCSAGAELGLAVLTEAQITEAAQEKLKVIITGHRNKRSVNGGSNSATGRSTTVASREYFKLLLTPDAPVRHVV